MIALVLDASGLIGTVALLRDNIVKATAEVEMRGADHERLLPAVQRALHNGGVELPDVTDVICGEGPGSFTSLRVAAALAKGIAIGRGLPLRVISSLALIAGAVDGPDGTYLAVSDAQRGEHFAEPYDIRGQVIRRLSPFRVQNELRSSDWAKELNATLIGPGHDGSTARAAAAARFAALPEGLRRVDISSWEPTYGRVAAPQARADARVSQLC